MARRKTPTHAQPQTTTPGAEAPQTSAGEPGRAASSMRVLLVAASRAVGELVASRLGRARVTSPPDAAAAFTAASRHDFDVAIIDASLPAPGALGLTERLLARRPTLVCILLCERPTNDLTLAAMRTGISDVIAPTADAAELAQRLGAAIARANTQRGNQVHDQRRLRRLRALCRSLYRSRNELVRQLASLSGDVAGSVRDVSDQIKQVAAAAEFNAMVRQELDLEGLLRTTLEYSLKRIGSMNAAIFLPGAAGDFTLGAYVNYDCPKESGESLLDHLADVLPPAFEEREGVTVMRGGGDLSALVGVNTGWLDDSTMAVCPCRQNGECVAVLAFFRDRRNPFPDHALPMFRLIADFFGQQLVRVIRTHNRHQPKDNWGTPGDSDDLDLAA